MRPPVPDGRTRGVTRPKWPERAIAELSARSHHSCHGGWAEVRRDSDPRPRGWPRFGDCRARTGLRGTRGGNGSRGSTAFGDQLPPRLGSHDRLPRGPLAPSRPGWFVQPVVSGEQRGRRSDGSHAPGLPGALGIAVGDVNYQLARLPCFHRRPGGNGPYLIVGTTAQGENMVNSGVLAAGTSSLAKPTLPSGSTLYATLFTEVNGTWSRYQSIAFTTGPALATFTHPLDGQLNVLSPGAFTWIPVAGAQYYDVTVEDAPARPRSAPTYQLRPHPAPAVLLRRSRPPAKHAALRHRIHLRRSPLGVPVHRVHDGRLGRSPHRGGGSRLSSWALAGSQEFRLGALGPREVHDLVK